MTCCCGKTCKGRKGLLMHQRSCKSYKSLRSTKSEVEPVDSGDNNATTFQHTSDSTTIPKPLPGIKLPKSSTLWAEANAFFHIELKRLDNCADVDNFAIKFQNIIYTYFASNYGTLTKDSTPKKHKNCNIRHLKTKLKNLKTLAQSDSQLNSDVIKLSRQIRATLKTNKVSKNKDNISTKLKQNFWKT
ncbi:hypothetical protein HELRODRAFT_168150 [Helobdella robusta]|uniref:Uncharacterized protein n=1 Tax=Helobdella robusta TaxID=6412 RepID=T1F082_HELRO|nr:hypothetical protein HELRODRAFT_168150 [Helobdella robusta]ESO10259.1 hypothetical protein HELRODRAFT_168150 [Helobdella robusta]